jgi:hypothetical protein
LALGNEASAQVAAFSERLRYAQCMSGDFILPEKGAVSEGDAVMCGSINLDEIPSSCKHELYYNA